MEKSISSPVKIKDMDKELFMWKVIRLSSAIGVILCALYVGSTAFAEEQEPDDYWLIPDIANSYIPRWVPVYYVDDIFHCEGYAVDARGCYVDKPIGEYIKIVSSMEFDWADQGCTVHDHEYFHVMGYKHGVGPLSTTCPNPWGITRNNTNMAYDENNWYHRDLTEDYKTNLVVDPSKGCYVSYWDDCL